MRDEGLVEVTRRGTFVKPDLKVGTRDKVDENSKLADGLAKSQSQEIAIMVADISLYQYGRVTAGASDSVNKTLGSMRLEVLQSHESVDKQSNLLLSIMHKKLAGVIMIPPVIEPTPAFHMQLLQEQGIPVVFCYRGVEGVRAPLVSWDWKMLGRKAAEVLVERGHKRIAYFGSWRYSIAQAYEEGMREVFAGT